VVVLDALARAVGSLPRSPYDTWSDHELNANQKALRCEIDRLEAISVGWAKRQQVRRTHIADGATSTVAWLRDQCGLSGGGAAQQMAIANDLPSVRGAGALFQSGALSFHKAAVLARTAGEIGGEAAAIASDALIAAAGRLSPEELRTVGRRLHHAVDPHGALARALRDHKRRRLDITQCLDGMFVVDGLLDAEHGALVRAAVDALGGRLPADERTPTQRRADALAELAAQRLTTGGLQSSGGVRPQLLVTATTGAWPASAGSPWARSPARDRSRRTRCSAGV